MFDLSFINKKSSCGVAMIIKIARSECYCRGVTDPFTPIEYEQQPLGLFPCYFSLCIYGCISGNSCLINVAEDLFSNLIW